ncbi:hypothetical protein [Halorhabdus sp. BNX81]|uniref:hypothetical protein n=1 Tax=Halorhabdus sp. BNX81 TaxID=2980181 RepID=UPI0023DD1907|nr:hypothetical protein [Halorhabdus sp. BNX81]WEL21551.1 Cytochrome cbb3 oxidase subunit I [Halorhabdus sp. BNX81]
MRTLTQDVDTEKGPPVAITLHHVALAVLVALAGQILAAATVDTPIGLSGIAHTHLFLAGFVGVTIMGAMTQFVPVWSGVGLYSQRLSAVEAWLVVAGLIGFVASMLTAELTMLHVAGTLLVAGIWVFVYNIARTLWRARPLDITEWHFAIALLAFFVLTILGYLLSLDYTQPLFVDRAITRTGVASAHVTVAVFGAFLTTVIGALYQLGEMFTQADDDRLDRLVQRGELVAYPFGVAALALGRLLSQATVARIGVVFVTGSIAIVGLYLARKLFRARTEISTVLRRYAVVAVAMVTWAGLTLPAWLAEPTNRLTVLGTPASEPVLLVGVLGFVVIGTLYHIVPFLVWLETYSDRIGYEPVPMVEDLYDSRLAGADLVVLLAGVLVQAVSGVIDVGSTIELAGVVAIGAGFVIVALNLALTVRHHGPHSLSGLLLPSLSAGPAEDA